MSSLRSTDKLCDMLLEFWLDAAEVVLEQYILGRYRRVGLQLEYPVSIGMLQRQQGIAGPSDSIIELPGIHLGAHRSIFGCRGSASHRRARSSSLSARVASPSGERRRRSGAPGGGPSASFAAATPESIAPSIVAGQPVST